MTLLSQSDPVNPIVSLELFRGREASGFLRHCCLMFLSDSPSLDYLFPACICGPVWSDVLPGAEQLFLSASVIVASVVLLSIQPSR